MVEKPMRVQLTNAVEYCLWAPGATMGKPVFTEYLQGNWPSQGASHVYSGTGID